MNNYRERQGFTITDLYTVLKKRCGYTAHFDTIRRYDRGERMPDARFVILLRKTLALTEFEFKNLVDAIIIDFNDDTYDTYRDLIKNLILEKSPCAPEPDIFQ